MYESFYGLTKKPFSLLPDPDFLYFSKEHAMASTMLEYSLMNHDGGITVVTGGVGVGKTTLVRNLLSEIEDNITLGYVDSIHGSYKELLQWVMMTFGQEFARKEKVELYTDFSQFIQNEYRNGKRTVLVVDEAQNVTMEGLEELRLLTNINTSEQFFQLVLIGQPELKGMLTRKELVQFSQRVSVCYHLEPLGKKDAVKYIAHRMEVAGSQTPVFDVNACLAIWHHSRGIPRLINILCDTALVYGYAEEKRQVGVEEVRKVLIDKKKYNLIPNQPAINNETESAAIEDILTRL